MAMLRKKQSLRGKSMTPLVKRLRAGEVIPPLERLAREIRTEEMGENDLTQAILRVTGEQPQDLLDMAHIENPGV